MKKIKRGLLILFCAFVVFAFYNYKMTFYLLSQLKGQLTIVYKAESIDEAIANKKYDSLQIQKLILIKAIKKYAEDSLGLAQTNNYSTIYNQHNRQIMFVVTGCLPFEFTEYKWAFPMIGDVTYKGFFDSVAAHSQMLSLQKQGYETNIGNASGWSTLGWLRDPVLSSMLNKSEGALAELIIHELTHATIFQSSSVVYNENLATFVGENGAIKFLIAHFGDTSVYINRYKNRLSDELLYNNHIAKGRKQLQQLYLLLKNENDVTVKTKKKNDLIYHIMTSIDTLSLKNKSRYTWNYKTDALPNNTFFMSTDTYHSMQNIFNVELKNKYANDLRKFIEGRKNK
jgi:predicted aminopeptidase